MKIVLLDLGGVLIDVVSAKRLGELIGKRLSFDEMSKRWTKSNFLKLYESGKCDRDTFVTGVLQELDMDLSPDEFLDEFKLFLKGFYPGAIELLKSISPDYTLACLTDTNETQWSDLCRRISIDSYFQYHFLSYEIGYVKPSEQVYQHVIENLKCKPCEIAYFDDNEANIQAGANAGMNAHKVVGVADLKIRLKELKII